MHETTTTFLTPEGEAGVYMARPDGDGPFPVVIYFHHGPGLDDGSKEAARMIGDWGYYVACPDRYWREQPWLTFDMAKARAAGDEDVIKRMFSILMGTTDDMVESDVTALLDHLHGDAAARDDRMGTIGYCIGARSVLRTMANHPDTVVAGCGLHPSFCTTDGDDSPHLAVPSFKGHLYIGFGSLDKMQSPDANKPLIEAVRGLGECGTVDIHEGADHGFGVPGGSAYHEAAAARSYDHTKAMFARALA